MKTSATWAVAAALAAAVVGSGSCIAGESSASSILGGLAGAAVSTSELNQQHARGVRTTNIDSTYTVDSGGALSNGALRGNSVVGNSATGTITTTGSINDNNGFTTVIQNSGNNSLFQQTTAVYITLAR
jgi:hypothetical protein